MQKLEVGSPFSGTIPSQDQVQFDFLQSGAVCILFYSEPSSNEVQSIKNGLFQAELLELEDIIFMLFRFGTLNWIDCPYTVYLSKPFQFAELEEGMGFALQIILVDRRTTTIKALRLIGLEHDFSKRLFETIERQKKLPFDLNVYNRTLDQIYKKFQTDDLVKLAKQQ